MIQPIKYSSVNWVDGMKISQRHLTANENHLNDIIRDVASCFINKFNFGLLPVSNISEGQNLFEITNSATNDVQLIIRNCNAITASGYRIAIEDLRISVNSLQKGKGAEDTDINQLTASYYILIAVNPFDRVPEGEFDPEETPPRHLFTKPKYHVELIPVSSITKDHFGGNYIIVGLVNYNNGTVRADQSFIPPCTSVASHPDLLRHFNNNGNIMASLQQYSRIIIRKNAYKNQNSVVSRCIRQLCETMLVYFSGSYFQYRNMVHQLPPVNMIDTFSKLAYNLYNTLELMPEKEKEETLNYCNEWSDVQPHILLNQLSAVVEINYNHFNNGEYMQQIKLLMGNLQIIWEKLSALDYIGQHKENIVVKEEAVTQMIKEKKGWSIID